MAERSTSGSGLHFAPPQGQASGVSKRRPDPEVRPNTDLTPGVRGVRDLQFGTADARRQRHDARNAGIIRQIWEPDGMPLYGPRKGLRAS